MYFPCTATAAKDTSTDPLLHIIIRRCRFDVTLSRNMHPIQLFWQRIRFKTAVPTESYTLIEPFVRIVKWFGFSNIITETNSTTGTGKTKQTLKTTFVPFKCPCHLDQCAVQFYTSDTIYIYGSFKYSRNYVISKKYKRVQSFKLNFLQSTPLVHLCTSASDRKGAGNIRGSHFVEDFSALTSHS